MARYCKGGAHDGASVYLDAQARECVSNGGQVVDDGGCVSENIVAFAAAPERAGATADSGTAAVLLFPLRLARALHPGAPFVGLVDAANDETAAPILELLKQEPELQGRLHRLLVEFSARCTLLIQAALGDERACGFTVDPEFAAEAVATLRELAPRIADRDLRARLEAILQAAPLMTGVTYGEISRRFRGSTAD